MSLLKNVIFMNPTSNIDDVVQIDNVNCKGENAEVVEVQFERSKVYHSILNKITGCPSSSSMMAPIEVKSTKSSF